MALGAVQRQSPGRQRNAPSRTPAVSCRVVRRWPAHRHDTRAVPTVLGYAADQDDDRRSLSTAQASGIPVDNGLVQAVKRIVAVAVAVIVVGGGAWLARPGDDREPQRAARLPPPAPQHRPRRPLAASTTTPATGPRTRSAPARSASPVSSEPPRSSHLRATPTACPACLPSPAVGSPSSPGTASRASAPEPSSATCCSMRTPGPTAARSATSCWPTCTAATGSSWPATKRDSAIG